MKAIQMQIKWWVYGGLVCTYLVFWGMQSCAPVARCEVASCQETPASEAGQVQESTDEKAGPADSKTESSPTESTSDAGLQEPLPREASAPDQVPDVAAPETSGPDLAPGCPPGTANRPCKTACGTGEETCTNGVWTGCTAPKPQAEICGNGKDDDCNGQIDDGCSAWKGYFPQAAIWYQKASTMKVHKDSTKVINWLSNNGGWGLGRAQIDFSIHVLQADATTPLQSFTKTSDHYTPDCDFTKVPVPVGGAIEGETGYRCASDGDCHLIVVHPPTQQLFEMWRADIMGSTFRGGCLAVWDMKRVYGPEGRGDQCTSADAAGFPIAPLLFTPEEVKAGAINHAIRFILPNARIRRKVYVRPATHSTGATSGGPDAPPYGVHFRLKAGVDISQLSPGGQVVAKALKEYGMYLSDGGNVLLTAQSDRGSQVKWAGLLGPRDLQSLQVTDFEMMDHGPALTWDGNCVRVP